MTPFLTELEVQLRRAAEREVASTRGRSMVVARHRLWSVMRLAPAFVAVGLAVMVFGFALVFLHHGRPRTHPSAPAVTTPAGAVLPIGAPAGPTRQLGGAGSTGIEQDTVKIAAAAPDLHGGLPWGVESFQTTDGQTCVLAGRDQSGRLGVIGEDGTFNNDSRFHMFTRYTRSSYCGQTDGNGNAFIVISDPATAASGDDQVIAGGCRPSSASARAAHTAVCPKADTRQLEYGLLGPDATSVTYTVGTRSATVATGPGGAFIVVGPPTKSKLGAGVSDRVLPGLVTAVHYRNGSTCRPRQAPVPGHESLACPLVGYRAPRGPRVTSSDVRTPVTATVITAHRWCGNSSGHYIACDRHVPADYRVLHGSGGMVLLQWSWLARVAASGTNAGYEYAITDGPPCGGGQSSSGVIHARRGQRIVQQSLGSSACAQRDTISVEYRTNVGPGGANFANPPHPGHDQQPFVGATTIYVPR
jgi:hypothetical protein